jgi:hypothetical protein
VLAIPSPSTTVDALIAPLILQAGPRLLLLVPTADTLPPIAREQLAKAQALVLDLETHLVLVAPGHLQATGGALKLLADHARPACDHDTSEAARIFKLMKLLESEPRQRKAPLLTVFRLLILDGLTQKQAARHCTCAESLITARAKSLEARFGMTLQKLRAHSAALSEMQTSVKHARYQVSD